MSAIRARETERTVGLAHPAVRHAVEAQLLEERTRWAMQVHDGLTQSVTSAVLELQTLRHRIETDPEAAAGALKEVEDEIRKDLHQIRELLFEMTSEAPDTAGPALTALVRDARERWHLAATIDVDGDLDSMPDEVLDAAYAIIRESLANAAKHADVAEAHVDILAGRDALRLQVEDRGNGLDVIHDDNRHLGLQLMRARAEALGGSLEIEAVPGRGTIVVSVLPVGGRGEGR